jgi:putative ABC transport system permease protein
MDGLLQDFRFGVRALRRNPLFSVLVVLVLALGIGANTAIFSVVNAVLLRPLSAASPERLVTIRESNPEFGWVAQVAAPANMLDWREGVAAFEDVAGHNAAGNMTLTGTGEPELVTTVQVTGNFFDVLGVPAVLGRTLREEETWSTAPRVVVLAESYWSSRFGRDPSIVGQMLTLNGVGYEVVGVMPGRFTFPAEDVGMWVPFRWDPEATTQVFFRRAHWVNTVARLRPGVTPAQADAELQVVVQRLARDFPETNRVMGANVYPLQAFLVKDLRTPLLLLLGAVVLLLLVACANAGNLMLVRAAGRSRELAVRSALGGGAGRIVRLVLTESMLLSMAGGVLGLALGFTTVRALTGLMPPTLPSVDTIAIDSTVLGFALAITLVSGLFFGAMPALRASRTVLSDTLREGGRGGSAGRRTLRTANILVVLETAVALILVLGAGLLVRSFVAMREVDPGFALEDRVTARIALPGARYDSIGKVLTFYDRVLERVRAAPGVLAAGMSNTVPLIGSGYTSQFVVEGWPADRFGAEVTHQRVTPGWFETLDIDLRAGRMLEVTDRSDTEPVLLINETLARQYFEGDDPIGRRIAFDRVPGPNTTWWRIVGVVEDVHQVNVDSPPLIEVYEPVAQSVTPSMAIFVHGTRPSGELISIIRSAVAELDRDIPLAAVRTLDDVYARSLRQDRFLLTLLTAFAALALLLAALGVYGVSSQAAKRRTHEIGIRVALGAKHGDVLGLIMRQGLLLVGTGITLGVAGGLAATRVMESVLQQREDRARRSRRRPTARMRRWARRASSP